MPVAYYRHYESNKRMKREMEIFRLSEKLRKELKEKPYLVEFIKQALSWDEQQTQRAAELLWNLKSA